MKRQAAKKYVLIALKIALIVILIFNMTTAILAISGLNAHLEVLPFAFVSVEGGSMASEIENGDLIVVGKHTYSELNIGDDVTFLAPDGFVTHRIVDVKDGEYVTRGLSNEIDDTYTMGAEEYCGKVMMSIPFLGYGVQMLTASRLAMALCVILIIALCFGGVIIRKIRELSRRTEENQVKRFSLSTRIVSCLCTVSCLFCVPYITDTKYAGKLIYTDIAVAQPLYLSSNYLGEGEGNKYSVQGWRGEEYKIRLEVRNYDNELLYNPEGFDIRYGLGYKVYADDVYSGAYELSITSPQGVSALNDFDYPDEWTDNGITPKAAYSMSGGTSVCHTFDVAVTPNTVPMEAKTKIRFELFVTTEIGKHYTIEMLGSFELQVAETTHFLNEASKAEFSTMVTYNVTTNLINDGKDEKVILFQWNPDFLYINEFESTFFNYISKHGTSCYSKADGMLWMKTQAYASINLEFFKYNDVDKDNDGNPDTPDYDITVDLVEDVGLLPGETAS